MNVKKAIIISLLSISIVGITAFALKHKDKNTNQPFMQTAYADNTPNSKRWLLNQTPALTNSSTYTDITFNTGNTNFYYTTADATQTGSYQKIGDGIKVNNANVLIKKQGTNQGEYLYRSGHGTNEISRIIEFINTPTILNWLQANATPIYEDKYLLYGNISQQILSVENEQNETINTGTKLTENITLKVKFDQATTKIVIGNTILDQSQWTSTLTIQDEDIKIQSFGQSTGVQGYTLTINYIKSIDNLTTTKWKINDTIETQSTDQSYSINYYSNYDRYLRYQTFDIEAPSTIFYNDVKTLNANVWDSYKYQTIFIIDGTDVQNPNLLAFLNANAEYLGRFTPPAPPIDIEDGNMVSIQTLMLNILTLPFTFITKAFDVTLWPNTAYEFNIGNFIMGIIAISAVLFIIKLFTSGFAVVGNYTNKSSQTRLNKAKTKQIKQQTKQAKSESDNKE